MQNYNKIKQKGYNPDYPKVAEVWKYGDPIPEWLSDRAEIKGLDKEGKPVLDVRKETTGEIEILESGKRNILVKLKSEDSVLLYSETHPIISLTPHQLELLY